MLSLSLNDTLYNKYSNSYLLPFLDIFPKGIFKVVENL